MSVHGFSVQNVHRQPAKCATAIRKVSQSLFVAVWTEFVRASPTGRLVYGQLLCIALRLAVAINCGREFILNHALWKKKDPICMRV